MAAASRPMSRLLEQRFSSKSTQRLWIMVAGPYRSGSIHGTTGANSRLERTPKMR